MIWHGQNIWTLFKRSPHLNVMKKKGVRKSKPKEEEEMDEPEPEDDTLLQKRKFKPGIQVGTDFVPKKPKPATRPMCFKQNVLVRTAEAIDDLKDFNKEAKETGNNIQAEAELGKARLRESAFSEEVQNVSFEKEIKSKNVAKPKRKQSQKKASKSILPNAPTPILDESKIDLSVEYNRLKKKYFEDVGFHKVSYEKITDLTTKLNTLLTSSENKLDETGKIISTSDLTKNLLRKIKFHAGLQAEILKMLPPTIHKNLNEKKELMRNFQHFQCFMLEYVFPLGCLTNRVAICSQCWLIFIPHPKYVDGEKIIFLDKELFTNNETSIEQKAGLFLDSYYTHSSFPRERVPLPEILIPGTKGERNRHECYDFFDELQRTKYRLRPGEKRIPSEVAVAEAEREEQKKEKKIEKERAAPKFEDLMVQIDKSKRKYDVLVIKQRGEKEYEIRVDLLQVLQLKYDPNRRKD
jgi:hypothetical protein